MIANTIFFARHLMNALHFFFFLAERGRVGLLTIHRKKDNIVWHCLWYDRVQISYQLSRISMPNKLNMRRLPQWTSTLVCELWLIRLFIDVSKYRIRHPKIILLFSAVFACHKMGIFQSYVVQSGDTMCCSFVVFTNDINCNSNENTTSKYSIDHMKIQRIPEVCIRYQFCRHRVLS